MVHLRLRPRHDTPAFIGLGKICSQFEKVKGLARIPVRCQDNQIQGLVLDVSFLLPET